ncbi:MAG: type II toxin-antitoxin system RelE/ParE family toxin [archaeon]
MGFKLIFSEEASSQLKKMENIIAKRVLVKLDNTKEDPFQYFERLAGREEYKLRVGDYRIIAKIFPNENNIFIFSIGHRKNIYKKIK